MLRLTIMSHSASHPPVETFLLVPHKFCMATCSLLVCFVGVWMDDWKCKKGDKVLER
jgi:hypothetical protein